jgi:hypothetical protein
MACSILILLWVQDEFSYDKFHEDSERMFRIHLDIFVLAFVVAITIAWLTVSYESIRATLINPAESLRNE